MTAAPERADARANHARLLDAAAELFAERGMSAEIRDVAERAGLSVGAVYRHFASKDDLIAAILDQLHAETERVIDAAIAIDELGDALRALVRSAVELALRRGELVKAMLEAGALDARFAAASTRRRALTARLRGLIERGMAEGAFRADLDPAVAAATLSVAFQPWSLAVLREERTTDALVDQFVDLFLRGACDRR